MNKIKIKCPAKINLTLEIVNRREDGFHNIKSVMQLINLYDYLEISAQKAEETMISLSGNCDGIPYDEKNLVYKASEAFLKECGISARVEIYIDKNIPISAGLAGGSTDAAGTIFGLNKIFGEPLDKMGLHKLCATLGSDLNVCLEGGCLLATSRGEKVEKLCDVDMPVSLIKPKELGISAKEAYTKYAKKDFKPKYDKTEQMLKALQKGDVDAVRTLLYNDLEYAVFDDYEELQLIKSLYPDSIMSGSGSTYFVLRDLNKTEMENYDVITGLNFIKTGVEVA